MWLPNQVSNFFSFFGCKPISSVSCEMRNFRIAKLCETFRTACVDVPKRAKRAKLVSHKAAVRITATAAAMSDIDTPAHKKRKAGGRPVTEKIWKHFKHDYSIYIILYHLNPKF